MLSGFLFSSINPLDFWDIKNLFAKKPVRTCPEFIFKRGGIQGKVGIYSTDHFGKGFIMGCLCPDGTSQYSISWQQMPEIIKNPVKADESSYAKNSKDDDNHNFFVAIILQPVQEVDSNLFQPKSGLGTVSASMKIKLDSYVDKKRQQNC